MDEKENKKRAMQLAKTRFRQVGRLLTAEVEINPDGTYQGAVKLAAGLPDGNYHDRRRGG